MKAVKIIQFHSLFIFGNECFLQNTLLLFLVGLFFCSESFFMFRFKNYNLNVNVFHFIWLDIFSHSTRQHQVDNHFTARSPPMFLNAGNDSLDQTPSLLGNQEMSQDTQPRIAYTGYTDAQTSEV